MPIKPSKVEEEYFAKVELEKKKKREAELQKKKFEHEREKFRELHYMRCPKCGMELQEVDYKKIKIDRCTNCQGVWLDEGELEAVSKFEKKALDDFFRNFIR